jgi:UDP-N-acetylglucosamine acyltransferase
LRREGEGPGIAIPELEFLVLRRFSYMAKIHPTAIVAAEAKLGEGVTIGPYAIVDGPVTMGEGCELCAHSRVIGPLTMGARNIVHSMAVIGGAPQDHKFKGEFSETIIGDENEFRECVTISRGTGLNARTVIGHRNYFMANSHVGHNSTVGNDVTFVNGAAMAGHTSIGDRSILGIHCAIHQHCRIGRLVMTSNCSVYTVDFPPFFLSMYTNTVHQLNAVGLRRSGMPRSSINGLRRMFQMAFREQGNRPLMAALESLPAEVLAVPEVQEVITFCRASKRGVAKYVPWSQQKGRQEREEEVTG